MSGLRPIQLPAAASRRACTHRPVPLPKGRGWEISHPRVLPGGHGARAPGVLPLLGRGLLRCALHKQVAGIDVGVRPDRLRAQAPGGWASTVYKPTRLYSSHQHANRGELRIRACARKQGARIAPATYAFRTPSRGRERTAPW
eukprot:5863806-Pyramimonas_sp.AAC.1